MRMSIVAFIALTCTVCVCCQWQAAQAQPTAEPPAKDLDRKVGGKKKGPRWGEERKRGHSLFFETKVNVPFFFVMH
jgi:hypothetical protein